MAASTVRRYLKLESSPPVKASTLTPTTLRYQAKNALRLDTPTQEIVRRALNFSVALLGIVITAPLMLVIAMAIKLSSKGPVFYSQPRVGVDRRTMPDDEGRKHRRRQDQGGRIFTIYKFRTMRPQQGNTRQVWAGQNDPRITSVGKVLRATRLDELPQLFNVLKGDMNIVGPRPEQPAIFQDLQAQLGRYRYRQRVLPGITGLAQVSLGYDSSVDDVKKKVALDLEYIRRKSPAKDLVIMAKTMPVMVLRQGSR